MAATLQSRVSVSAIGASSLFSSSAIFVSSTRLPRKSSQDCSARCSLKVSRFQPLRVDSPKNVRGGAARVSSDAVSSTSVSSDPGQLKSAREDIRELLKSKFCHPILIRLGWHDSGTYDKNIEEWPQRGGADGSLRFEPELKHGANAGLVNALNLLQPIKDKYPGITYADLFQLASATAIEEAGGPKIPMKYGRVDVTSPDQCPEEGKLPDAGPPSPATHLRTVFNRMGLDDKEIVALSGAHTLGRSRPERSGWGKPETKYTKDGPGAPGGQSWTVQWLKFDNSYFKEIKEKRDEDLLVLPTDAVLFEDPSFKIYAEKYAQDQEAFFKDYAEAHAKLSNLGAKFDPPEGFSIDDNPKQPVPEKFVAAKYSSGKKELSSAMKQKIRAEYEGLGGSPDKPLQSNYFLNIIIFVAVLALLSSLFAN
ncbi:thylakoidal ascorbate peroxidase isoform X2 [Wolffia australiana]